MGGTDTSQEKGLKLKPNQTCWVLLWMEFACSPCVCLCGGGFLQLVQFPLAAQGHALD